MHAGSAGEIVSSVSGWPYLVGFDTSITDVTELLLNLHGAPDLLQHLQSRMPPNQVLEPLHSAFHHMPRLGHKHIDNLHTHVKVSRSICNLAVAIQSTYHMPNNMMQPVTNCSPIWLTTEQLCQWRAKLSYFSVQGDLMQP